jgi:hypothetical protein
MWNKNAITVDLPVGLGVIVFNATFNNIYLILCDEPVNELIIIHPDNMWSYHDGVYMPIN